MLLFVILASVSLSISFLVETGSWWVRAFAQPKQFGLFISRSNILLYGGRFFALVFSTSISLAIETIATPRSIAITLLISFLVSFLTQIMFFNGSRFTKYSVGLILRVLVLSNDRHASIPRVEFKFCKIYIYTTISSLFFGFGISVPLILASVFPEYRLSISNVGQVINAGGMIVLLLFVDQPLFKSMDRDELLTDIRHYSYGRMTAFGVLAIICLFVTFVAPG
jgi:hypothetical protein